MFGCLTCQLKFRLEDYYDQCYYYPSGQSEEGDSGASYYNYNDGRDYKGAIIIIIIYDAEALAQTMGSRTRTKKAVKVILRWPEKIENEQ